MNDGWPETVPVAQIDLIEGIGWPALMMVNDGRFAVERDAHDRPIGLRFDLKKDWWIVVVATPDGYSIGRFRAMVPFGWVHNLSMADLTGEVQRVAAEATFKGGV